MPAVSEFERSNSDPSWRDDTDAPYNIPTAGVGHRLTHCTAAQAARGLVRLGARPTAPSEQPHRRPPSPPVSSQPWYPAAARRAAAAAMPRRTAAPRRTASDPSPHPNLCPGRQPCAHQRAVSRRTFSSPSESFPNHRMTVKNSRPGWHLYPSPG